MSDVRLGAQAFVEQLIAGGVRWIFGNPGTTEQTVVDYLQEYEGIDLVLALHEGVAVGAADGYARACGKVGVVELHAGPGLGNGLGNLYNAYVSHTPMLVYVGHSEQRALYQEPVLSGDLVGMARPITKWAYEARTADEIPQIVRRALKVAGTPPCGPVLLSIPIDLTDTLCSAPVVPVAPAHNALRPDPRATEEAARILHGASAPVILVGDAVATSGAVAAVGRMAALLGAPIIEGAVFETAVAADDPLRAGRLPSDPAATDRFLRPYDTVVAVGTRVLAQVFPHPGLPLGSRDVVHIGADAWELGKNQPGTLVLGDERAAVEDLYAALDARVTAGVRGAWLNRSRAVRKRTEEARARQLQADRTNWDASPMSPHRALAEIAAALPEGVCIVDETMSAYEIAARYLPREIGSWFRSAGGIGMGLPRSIGVRVAYPDRPVVALVGDGSSMYSLTALWTAAHHKLPIVWVILNNRGYRTLKQNTLKARLPEATDHEFVGADVTDPDVDFVALGQGFGVQAVRVQDPAEIGPAIRRAVESRIPTVVDLVLSGQL